MPPPNKLTVTTEIQLQLAPLTLAFATSLPEGFFQNETLRINLRAQRHKSYGRYFDGISEEILVPFSSQVVFPALQPGSYQVQVRLAGAALWQSGDFQLGAQPMQISARLERGADVRYEILPPGKAKHDWNVRFQILRDGKPVDSYLHRGSYGIQPTNVCRSLPAGRYVFHVLSSVESRQQNRGPNEIIPQVPGYRGAELPFAIAEHSPKLIDLGVIRLASDDAGR